MHLVTRAWGASPNRPSAAVLPWRTDGGASVLLVGRAAGDPPPDGPPGHRPRLWEHEVVEWFLAGARSDYLEVELGPHGHHLVLQLSDVRQVAKTQTVLSSAWTGGPGWWAARADLDAAWLPAGPHRALACHVTGSGAARRHRTCTALPGPDPDFHQPQHFEETKISSTPPNTSTLTRVAGALGIVDPDAAAMIASLITSR